MEYMESKMQDHYESGNSLPEELEQLKAERDALAAQVDALRVAIKPFATGGVCSAIARESYSIMYERIKDWHGVSEFKKAQTAYNATPQQCLAEIKAEAGRAGFIEGVRQMCDNEIGILGHDAESCANHYAARVRLGFEPGTWLKDSNVNGGKRQGGEE